MQTARYTTWLDTQPVNENTRDMRVRALARVEQAYGIDLDQAYDGDRLTSLLETFLYSTQDAAQGQPNPTRMNIHRGDIRTQVAWYRTQVNSYRKFRESLENGPVSALIEEGDAADSDPDDEALTFGLEADLEAALRRDLGQLESGLTLADGGRQRKVASGFIDILGRAEDGTWVVVELKAGSTRPEAVAQVLGYMADIAEAEGGAVRGYLVGSDHHPRVEAAARIVPTLALRRYAYRFTFA